MRRKNKYPKVVFLLVAHFFPGKHGRKVNFSENHCRGDVDILGAPSISRISNMIQTPSMDDLWADTGAMADNL